MPDQKPNNASEDVTEEQDVGEPAAALQDIADAIPGGGGLGGDTAATTSPHGTGGPSPNTPVDVAKVPDDDAAALSEALSFVADDPAVTAHPRSS